MAGSPHSHAHYSGALHGHAHYCMFGALSQVDGPYKAMILPAAKEEGKKLKKRYVHVSV